MLVCVGGGRRACFLPLTLLSISDRADVVVVLDHSSRKWIEWSVEHFPMQWASLSASTNPPVILTDEDTQKVLELCKLNDVHIALDAAVAPHSFHHAGMY